MVARCTSDLVRHVTTANIDDRLAVLQEQRGNGECLFDDPSTIFAEIEHESTGALLDELLRGCPELFSRVFVEGLERDVSDVVSHHGRIGHGRNVDDRALEGEFDRFDDAGAGIRYVDGRAGDAAQRVGHRVDLDVARNDERIHLYDDVPFEDTPLFGWSVRKDSKDNDARPPAGLLLLDPHSDTTVAATDVSIEFFIRLRSEELAIGVVELTHEPLGRLLEDRRPLE